MVNGEEVCLIRPWIHPGPFLLLLLEEEIRTTGNRRKNRFVHEAHPSTCTWNASVVSSEDQHIKAHMGSAVRGLDILRVITPLWLCYFQLFA